MFAELLREKLHILLVDDDPVVLKWCNHHLQKSFDSQIGLFCEIDPKRAEGILARHVVHILITDLDMVDRNGFHLLRKVKQFEPLTQVIIQTGHTSPNAFHSAFALGADEFLFKPVTPEALVASVTYLRDRLRRWTAACPTLVADGVTWGPIGESASIPPLAPSSLPV